MRDVEFWDKADEHLREGQLDALVVGTVVGKLFVGASIPSQSPKPQGGTMLLSSNRTNHSTCFKLRAELLPRDDNSEPPRLWGAEAVIRRDLLASLIGEKAVSDIEPPESQAQAGDGERTLVLTIEAPQDLTKPTTLNGVPIVMYQEYYADLAEDL